MIFRDLEYRNSLNWVDFLEDIKNNYNNTPKRSIDNLTPWQVLKDEKNVIHLKKYFAKELIIHNSKYSKPKDDFQKGDYVRPIIDVNTPFQKDYRPGFSDQIVRINRIKLTSPPTYYLSSPADPKRPYYAFELSKTLNPDDSRNFDLFIEKSRKKPTRILRSGKASSSQEEEEFLLKSHQDKSISRWITIEEKSKLEKQGLLK